MSLVTVSKRSGMSPAFKGAFDEKILERAHALDSFFSPHIVPSRISVEDDNVAIGIQTYKWSANKDCAPNKKPPLCIILNGIFTKGRSNDHTAYMLSQKHGVDTLCIDYPGKGKSSTILATKEQYTPRRYAAILRDLLIKEGHDYDEIFLIGYSHGGRIIYDLYEHGWDTQKIKGVIIGDMGPERPGDAAQRRAYRNQHAPVYENVTESIEKMTKFFSGHGKSLPEDFIIQTVNHNFHLVDDGDECGVQYSYDPRSMFGYCDEIISNPYMNSWKGFYKVTAPMLFLLGADTNTVTNEIMSDMVAIKKGQKSLQELYLSKKFSSQFSAAMHGLAPAKFYTLNFEGTGHYPEPHRMSHSIAMAEFMRDPHSYSIRDTIEKIHQDGILRFSREALRRNTDDYGIIPMTASPEEADLFPCFQGASIVPR